MKKLILLLGLAACGGAANLTAPPPPLRPKPIEVKEKPKPVVTKTDCDPTDPNRQLPAKTFPERSIPEATKLAAEGLAKLQAAEGNADKPSREKLITDAVDTFITALLADPYNVNATYNLAAAYARIGRKQCSINLLERLLQMRDHESRKVDVEAKIDRLLGRKKAALDPDFNDMRADARFRTLIEKMCAGSGDPACVFGSQPTKRP
ncbi:MAG TPA: hypothetical protein VL463_36665 [Kofleriaceae bacterium]|nr:hypothetical protein [Kofleriaceae bacterium]